jgi:hypothetical protein
MAEDMLRPGAPLPTSLGRCADLYRDVREVRLAMEKEAGEVKAREAEIREHLIRNLDKGGDTGAAGLRYRAQLVQKTHYRIAPADKETGAASGWGILCSWIRKNDRFDLLQKRINEAAATEFQQETGRVIPGLERMTLPDVSVTKI